MEKEFVPNEQAIALKELGFDEPCFICYRGCDLYRNGMGGYLSEMAMEINSDLDKYEINNHKQYWISAPTFSQAFRWFREKYGLFGQVNIRTYFIYDISDGFEIIKQYDKLTNTYEEAELACLIKLIEIVKTNDTK